MKNDLYSDEWFEEELKKIHLLSTSNKSFNPDTTIRNIEKILEFEFRSPLEICNNNFCDKTIDLLKKEPMSLNLAFLKFNKFLYNEIEFEVFLSMLRNFESYKNHLVFSFLFIYRGFFSNYDLLEFNNFKTSNKIAEKLNITFDDFENFCIYTKRKGNLC